MHATAMPNPPVERDGLQRVHHECCLFWQGVVESFGVEWRRRDTSAREDGAAPASPPTQGTTAQHLSAADASPSSQPPAPPQPSSAVSARTTHLNSPLQLDNTACPSPMTPSSASAVDVRSNKATTTTTTSSPVISPSSAPPSAPLRFWLMPPWSLVEYDPKLWMLLRKTLLANLALAALTLTYMGLSRRLVATTAPTSSSSAATSAASASLHSVGHSGSTPSRSVSGIVVFWWLRLCLWGLKYVGQWPFYTVLQIIGLVWYSQLYRETWLVRKRWVLRGTRLWEASAPSSNAAAPPPRPSVSAPLLPQLADGVLRPWLTPIPLHSPSHIRDDVPASAQYPVWQHVESLTLAIVMYVKHVAHLIQRMLRHKGPTAPLQEWVLGDAAAATAAAARQATLSSSSSASPHAQHANPDIFESIFHHLEATSEVIFKALASMSFAFCASCVEQLPIVGTPLCLVLNAQLYAFYVFDYRYATQQQPDAAHPRGSALLYQLHHFEQCWAYYAGYGIGSAVLSLWLTHRVGVVVSVCAMSVVYSWQVVWSGFATPLPSSRPLPVFSLWFYAVDMVRRQYAVLWRCVCILGLLYIPYQCLCYLF